VTADQHIFGGYVEKKTGVMSGVIATGNHVEAESGGQMAATGNIYGGYAWLNWINKNCTSNCFLRAEENHVKATGENSEVTGVNIFGGYVYLNDYDLAAGEHTAEGNWVEAADGGSVRATGNIYGGHAYVKNNGDPNPDGGRVTAGGDDSKGNVVIVTGTGSSMSAANIYGGYAVQGNNVNVSATAEGNRVEAADSGVMTVTVGGNIYGGYARSENTAATATVTAKGNVVTVTGKDSSMSAATIYGGYAYAVSATAPAKADSN
jgi:hypothetical protein